MKSLGNITLYEGSDEELQNSGKIFPKNSAIFNTDDDSLKFGNGEDTYSELPSGGGADGADGFPTEAQWNDLVDRVEALEAQWNDLVDRVEALEALEE